MACTVLSDAIEELQVSQRRINSPDEVEMQLQSSSFPSVSYTEEQQLDDTHTDRFSHSEKLFYVETLESLWNEAKSYPQGFTKTISTSTPKNVLVPTLYDEYQPNTPADQRIETMRSCVCSPVCKPPQDISGNLTMTPSLIIAQAKSWKFLWRFVVPEILRPITVNLGLFEIFFAIIAIMIAIPTIAVNATESILAFYDVMFLLVSLKWLTATIVRVVKQKNRESRRGHEYQYTLDNESGLDEERQSTTCCNCRLCKWFGSLHFIITKLDVHILLMLSIFGVMINRSYEVTTLVQCLSGIRFLWACFCFFVLIFVAQFVVVGRALWVLRRLCRFLPFLQTKFGYLFFTLYTCGQAVTLALVLTAIGARLFYDVDNSSWEIPFSPELIFMLLAGFIINLLGPCLFFFATVYWVEESVITICMNVLSALQTPQFVESIQGPNQDSEEICNKVSVVVAYMNPQEIIADYQKMKFNTPIYYKTVSGAFNPLSVAICIIYTGLLICFIICSIHSDGGLTDILDSSLGHKVVFALLTGGLVLCNLTTFVVSIAWIPVVFFYLAIQFHAFFKQ